MVNLCALRKEYPVGARIECIKMDLDPFPIPEHSIGTVVLVDDAGQIHVKWDCGGTLALIPGIDKFRLVD